MSSNNKWEALSMKDRAFLIREAVRNGITDIGSIRDTWEHRFDGLRDVVEKVNTSDADFAKRLRQEGRASIPDWEDPRRIATHKLGVATDENGIHYIFPSVQNIKGQLIDVTNPKTRGHGYEDIIAAERGDTIQIGNTNRDLRNAIKFTEKYKKLGIYPEFSEPPHTFDGTKDNVPTEDEYIAQRSAPSWWERFKTMNALQGGDPDTPILTDYRDIQKADNQEAAKLFEKQNKAASELDIKKGKATINALAFIGGLKNPFGLLGDLGITTASTAANTVLDGDTENLWNNLKTGAAWDLAGTTLQWLPKAIRGGKQVVKNLRALKDDFIIRPAIPRIQKMYNYDTSWYNFPHGYEFHFAEATPKKYMGELFYAPALEKSATKTASVNKTSFLDMANGAAPKLETDYIRLREGKNLDDVMKEPSSLYFTSSPASSNGYYSPKSGENVDLSSSPKGNETAVHEKKHMVQGATNAADDIITDPMGSYQRYPKQHVFKTGYQKILADQADFLRELDTGVPPESQDAVANLVFENEGSRNLEELNATVTEALYSMFRKRFPYADEHIMNREFLDLFK